MPDDVFVMQRHYLSPGKSRAPQCGKWRRTSIQLQFECTEFRWRSSCTANWFVHHTGTYGHITQAIDKNQPTGNRVLLITINTSGSSKVRSTRADAVQRQVFNFALGKVIDINLITNAINTSTRLLTGNFDVVTLAGKAAVPPSIPHPPTRSAQPVTLRLPPAADRHG